MKIIRFLLPLSLYSSSIFAEIRIINPITPPAQQLDIADLIGQLKNTTPTQLHETIKKQANIVLVLVRQLKQINNAKNPASEQLLKVFTSIFSQLNPTLKKGIEALRSMEGHLTINKHLENASSAELKELESLVKETIQELTSLNMDDVTRGLVEYYSVILDDIHDTLR